MWLVSCPIISVYSYEVLQCHLGGKPSTPRLTNSASGTWLSPCWHWGRNCTGALCRQVLLRLASSAPGNLSAKCTSCSFNSSKPKFLFKYTFPRKLGSGYLNITLCVLEPESVKFNPFSGELHLELHLKGVVPAAYAAGLFSTNIVTTKNHKLYRL